MVHRGKKSLRKEGEKKSASHWQPDWGLRGASVKVPEAAAYTEAWRVDKPACVFSLPGEGRSVLTSLAFEESQEQSAS